MSATIGPESSHHCRRGRSLTFTARLAVPDLKQVWLTSGAVHTADFLSPANCGKCILIYVLKCKLLCLSSTLIQVCMFSFYSYLFLFCFIFFFKKTFTYFNRTFLFYLKNITRLKQFYFLLPYDALSFDSSNDAWQSAVK